MSTNLVEIFKNVNGSTFIGISTSVEPRMLGGKKNPFKGRVKKVTTGANVMVFTNKNTNSYKNMVENRLKKEGKVPDFKLSPRVWGKRIPNTPFVENKGTYYLEVIFLNRGKTHYELDGKETIPTNEWRLHGSSEEGEQGGLDDKVVIRTFKVTNLTKVKINKTSHDSPTFDFSVLE